MAGYGANSRSGENHGNKKKLVAALAVALAVAVLLIVFLLAKNSIFRAIAESKAENGNFSSAYSLLKNSADEESLLLKEYISLRIDINENYPLLLSDFSEEKVYSWAENAERINAMSAFLDEDLAKDINNLSQKLNVITDCIESYKLKRNGILSLMDVFNEINRLHTKDAEGKNTAFTVAEMRSKIGRWQQLSSEISSFAASLPDTENIYLFNYMIKEAFGEIDDLSIAIESVIQSGYSETDNVRFSGDAQKRFPDISNSSNESVNLLEKEKYERFMFDEICRKLVETLGEFYSP